MNLFDSSAFLSTVVDRKYRVERLLGRGGMGAVFLATHVGTGRPVALKLIVPRFASDQSFVERFRREARAAGRVRHPNVVDVTDFGFADIDGRSVAYLVMEYLDGCSLDEILVEQPRLPIRLVVDVMEQLCLGVGALHREGIVHRDLKPSNTWLEPNFRGGFTVKVLDFGLAKLHESRALSPSADEVSLAATASAPVTLVAGSGRTPEADAPTLVPASESAGATELLGGRSGPGPAAGDLEPTPALTQAGSILGTPAYMSPEQCLGKPAGPESDIYSLGVIAYQMLAGVLPFEGNGAELVTKHVSSVPAPLHELNPDVPRAVSDVVAAALSKNASDRLQSPELFAAALRAKSEGVATTIKRGLLIALEQLPVFLRVAALLLLPAYLVLVARLVMEALTAAGELPEQARGLWSIPLGLGGTVAVTLASVLTRGVAALVVAQLLVAPSRPVRVGLAFESLGRVLRPALTAALLLAAVLMTPPVAASALLRWAFAASALAGTTADLLPVIAAGALAVAVVLVGLRLVSDTLQIPNAVLAEGLGIRDAVDRSRQLARRAPFDSIVVSALVLGYTTAPWLAAPPMEALSLRSSAAEALLLAAFQTLAIMVVPVIVAVLYFKQRLAAGESETLVFERQYVKDPPPTSRWERRLDSSAARRRSGAGSSGAWASGDERPSGESGDRTA